MAHQSPPPDNYFKFNSKFYTSIQRQKTAKTNNPSWHFLTCYFSDKTSDAHVIYICRDNCNVEMSRKTQCTKCNIGVGVRWLTLPVKHLLMPSIQTSCQECGTRMEFAWSGPLCAVYTGCRLRLYMLHCYTACESSGAMQLIKPFCKTRPDVHTTQYHMCPPAPAFRCRIYKIRSRILVLRCQIQNWRYRIWDHELEYVKPRSCRAHWTKGGCITVSEDFWQILIILWSSITCRATVL